MHWCYECTVVMSINVDWLIDWMETFCYRLIQVHLENVWHCATIWTAKKSVAKQYNLLQAKGRWCSTAGEVTAGLAECHGSLPPDLWPRSPAGWLPRTRNSSAPGHYTHLKYATSFKKYVYNETYFQRFTRLACFAAVGFCNRKDISPEKKQ